MSGDEIRKGALSVVILLVVLAAISAAAMAGFRYTTTRVVPGQPAPSESHPQSRCAWCHIEVRP
mgnify:CR=1 FL=1